MLWFNTCVSPQPLLLVSSVCDHVLVKHLGAFCAWFLLVRS